KEDNQAHLDFQEAPRGGNLTALYDALYVIGNDRLFRDRDELRNSALLVFSDGEDNLSRHGPDEAIESLQSAGVLMYAISTHGRVRNSRGDAVLRDLASSTGGRAFIAADGAEAREALSTIRDELRASYRLYYRSPNEAGDHRFRHIILSPLRNDGPILRHR